MDATTRLLSPREAADLLGVSIVSIRRYYTAGRLRATRIGPKLVKFRPEDLEAFAAGALAPAGVAV